MPKTVKDFHLVEETIEKIRQIERNLELSLLDVSKDLNLGDAKTLRKIDTLIENLDVLFSELSADPRLLRLVTDVKGLRDFLETLRKALEGNPAYEKLLAKGSRTKRDVNTQIIKIVQHLDRWTRLAQEKVHSHLKGKYRNEYLDKMPSVPSRKQFYIYVKELNPLQTRYRHPFDERQVKKQEERKTEDLIKYDAEDPISGYRVWQEGDSQIYPGSGIRITEGHHRVFELFKRYLQGKLSGDTLILVKEDHRL